MNRRQQTQARACHNNASLRQSLNSNAALAWRKHSAKKGLNTITTHLHRHTYTHSRPFDLAPPPPSPRVRRTHHLDCGGDNFETDLPDASEASLFWVQTHPLRFADYYLNN